MAVAEALPFGEVRSWGKIANAPASLERLIKQLRGADREIKVCYEAGPCGYGIYRQLAAMAEVTCVVAAPSLIWNRGSSDGSVESSSRSRPSWCHGRQRTVTSELTGFRM
ncbi:MAG: hypothetical protein HC843_11685 [Sphingomonadales bacterium]|nr:hypothetical protein [Sphingomonadales bacterium]